MEIGFESLLLNASLKLDSYKLSTLTESRMASKTMFAIRMVALKIFCLTLNANLVTVLMAG